MEWVAGDRELETIRFKVEDGVIVFPMDAKGKRADAEGVFTKIEITKEQALAHAKHMAEEKGEAFDPTKAGDLPTVIYQIQGNRCRHPLTARADASVGAAGTTRSIETWGMPLSR